MSSGKRKQQSNQKEESKRATQLVDHPDSHLQAATTDAASLSNSKATEGQNKRVSAVGTSGASGAQDEYITNLEPEVGEVPDPVERKVVQPQKQEQPQPQQTVKPTSKKGRRAAAAAEAAAATKNRELRDAKLTNNFLFQQITQQARFLKQTEQSITSHELVELETPAFARMYPQDKTKQVAAAADGVVRPEDIDYYWDHPAETAENRKEILDIIQKNVNNRDNGAASLEDEKPQPLFPKNPRKEQSNSALQDSIELESLFSHDEMRNSKSFQQIIAQNRERQMSTDADYRKAHKVLGYGQKHVLVGDVSTESDNRKGGILSSNTPTTTLSQSKFLGTPNSNQMTVGPMTVNPNSQLDKLAYSSKFFRLGVQANGGQQEVISAGEMQRNRRQQMRQQKNTNQAAQQEARKLEIKEWFKNLSPEERVLCLTTIDKEICDIVREVLCKRQRQTNSLQAQVNNVDKLQSLLFLILNVPVQGTWDFDVTSKKSGAIETKGKKSGEMQSNHSEQKLPLLQTVESGKKRAPAKYTAQLELIHQMRMTETFEPLDTLTVASELVQDGDKFFDLCEQCVGTNFMRVPLSFKRHDSGKFECNFPTWFQPNKPTSMAEWLLFFIERAIWLQFKANVEQNESQNGRTSGAGSYRSLASCGTTSCAQPEVGMERLLAQKDGKNQTIFIPTDGRTISFKESILPYWRQICEGSLAANNTTNPEENNQDQKDESLQSLFESFKQGAESEILVTASAEKNQRSDLNWLTGGLRVDDSNPEMSLSNLKFRLGQQLKFFEMRFKQMVSGKEKLAEMLSFVGKLGMVPLKDLFDDEYELIIRLESLLIETLNLAYKKQTVDSLGLTSGNPKLRKKKLKKKQNQLKAQAKEQQSKQENQKRQAIEESRQMQLIDEAEANPQLDEAHRRALMVNQKRRLQQIEAKNQAFKEKQEEIEQQLIDKRQEETSSVEGVMRGLRPDSANGDEEIPQYPGRLLDPRGASSMLQQRINQNMTQL